MNFRQLFENIELDDRCLDNFERLKKIVVKYIDVDIQLSFTHRSVNLKHYLSILDFDAIISEYESYYMVKRFK